VHTRHPTACIDIPTISNQIVVIRKELLDPFERYLRTIQDESVLAPAYKTINDGGSTVMCTRAYWRDLRTGLAVESLGRKLLRAPSHRNYSNAACVSLTAQYAAEVPQIVVDVASVPK
jgi:hypothetical protein